MSRDLEVGKATAVIVILRRCRMEMEYLPWLSGLPTPGDEDTLFTGVGHYITGPSRKCKRWLSLFRDSCFPNGLLPLTTRRAWYNNLESRTGLFLWSLNIVISGTGMCLYTINKSYFSTRRALMATIIQRHLTRTRTMGQLPFLASTTQVANHSVTLHPQVA